MKDRKKPEADLRKSYNLYLQTGMIVTLLLGIGIFPCANGWR